MSINHTILLQKMVWKRKAAAFREASEREKMDTRVEKGLIFGCFQNCLNNTNSEHDCTKTFLLPKIICGEFQMTVVLYASTEMPKCHCTFACSRLTSSRQTDLTTRNVWTQLVQYFKVEKWSMTSLSTNTILKIIIIIIENKLKKNVGKSWSLI